MALVPKGVTVAFDPPLVINTPAGKRTAFCYLDCLDEQTGREERWVLNVWTDKQIARGEHLPQAIAEHNAKML